MTRALALAVLAFVTWARAHAIPISRPTGSTLTLSPMAGEAVARLAKNATIVGIGESMHDTHELSLTREAITYALISRTRVAAIVLESSLVDARDIDRWITGVTDSTPDFSRDLSYGWGEQSELRSALDALRTRNMALPPARRIHFHGMDLPANGGGSLLPALTRAWSYLDRVDPAYVAISRTRLLPSARKLDSDSYGIVEKYAQLSRGERDSITIALAELVAHIAHNQARYVRSSSRDDFDWALRFARVAMQTEAAVRIGWNDASNPRDAAMADNLLWIAHREQGRGAVVVWSHNLHVSRAPIGGPVFAGRGGAPFVRSMGQRLHSSLGHRYVAIGSAFAQSGLDEQHVPLDEASVDATFTSVRSGWFFLPLRNSPATGPAARWLSEPRPKRVEGGYVTMPLHNSFDAIVFVDSLTSSRHVHQ